MGNPALRRVLGGVLLGCWTAGCGILPAPTARLEEIAEIKVRVLELQKKAAMAEVEIARLRAALNELQTNPSRPVAAPPASSAPVRELPPAVPFGGAPAPIGGIEEADLEPASPPFAAPEAPAVLDLEPVTAAAQADYDRAYTLHHQGRFAESERAFESFLSRFPRSELADNASYWIGESRYSRGDLRGALVAFQRTVERYPTGNKNADALLKLGQCFEGLGDPSSARAAYGALLERFSESAAAQVARQRLPALP
jgi:tol-pal system protein YbgF